MSHTWDERVTKLMDEFGEELISIFLDAQSELQEELKGKLVPQPWTINIITMQEKGQKLVVSFIGESLMMDAHAVVHYHGALWEIAIDENGEMNGDLMITQID